MSQCCQTRIDNPPALLDGRWGERLFSQSEADYRRLATEARAKALAAIDAYDKRTYLLVAQRYDVLAERARRNAEMMLRRRTA